MSIMSSKVPAPIIAPSTVHKVSLFSISSPTFVISWLSNNGHSDWHEEISHYSLDLHFPINEWCWTPFHVHVVICMSSLEKYLFRSSAHLPMDGFFLLLLSCISSLYILDINPLSDSSFANTFLHSIGCLCFVDGFLYCT